MPAFRKSQSRLGFTIVEMLVVVSIIGLLLGILLPSLAAANRRAKKTTELNHLRQVSKAWLMYANSNNDAALPGYLETPVQATRVPGVSRGWGVQYKYKDGATIPPAPTYGGATLNVAGPWTWRLMSYFDYAQDVVIGYRSEGDLEFYFEDVATNPEKAMRIAEQPSFGYNGFYVGGYWQMVTVAEANGSNVQLPRTRYYNHCEINNSNNTDRAPVAIPTKVGQIRRSADLITFCSSTMLSANAGVQGRFADDIEGSHLVTPPIRGTTMQWSWDQSIDTNQFYIEGGDFAQLPYVYVPLARYTKTAAVLYGDGHVDQQTYQGLFDQRNWIDSAVIGTYQHDVCP